MKFTVINLCDTLGNVRPFIIRSQESLDAHALRFKLINSRFSCWYNSQSEYVICGICEYPDRHTFETMFGW